MLDWLGADWLGADWLGAVLLLAVTKACSSALMLQATSSTTNLASNPMNKGRKLFLSRWHASARISLPTNLNANRSPTALPWLPHPPRPTPSALHDYPACPITCQNWFATCPRPGWEPAGPSPAGGGGLGSAPACRPCHPCHRHCRPGWEPHCWWPVGSKISMRSTSNSPRHANNASSSLGLAGSRTATTTLAATGPTSATVVPAATATAPGRCGRHPRSGRLELAPPCQQHLLVTWPGWEPHRHCHPGCHWPHQHWSPDLQGDRHRYHADSLAVSRTGCDPHWL